MLREPVAKREVPIQTHEFAKVNIGNARVTPDDDHVLIIVRSGSFTKVRRTGNNQRIWPQRIDEHVFRVQISNVNVQTRELLDEPVVKRARAEA